MSARRTMLCMLGTLLCAACTAVAPPPAPPPVVQRVEIPVPVLVPCTAPPEPDYAVDRLPIGAAIDEQARALLAEREQRKAYILKLRGACQ